MGPDMKAKGEEIQKKASKLETVLLPKYRGTKVVLYDKGYFLLRDGNNVGAMS